MNRLDALSKYFKGGQSESEKAIMKDIFVRPMKINEITDFTLSNYKIVIGPKGSGKSLIVDYLNEFYLSKGKISLVIRPKDLNMDLIQKKEILSEKTKEAKKQIYELVAKKIGDGISFATSQNEHLFKTITKDSQDKPVIARIGSFITSLLPEQYQKIVEAFAKIQEIDIEKFSMDEEVSKYLNNTDNKLIVMVDDLDKGVEEVDSHFQYGASWAIIEAAVEVANEIQNSAVIITVRTDIWYLMTKVQKIGSTIFDKVGTPYNLYVDEEWISHVFRKRINLCYDECVEERKRRPTYEIDYFFKPGKIGFYGHNEIVRTWEQWVGKNTRNRPRDMVRLMQMLISETKKENPGNSDAFITNKVLHKILYRYAQERVEYIKQEYIQIFPKIDQVIHLIKQTRYTFPQVRALLVSFCGVGIELDGKAIDPNNEKDRFRVLQFLHMASVINPREDFPDKSYHHYLFEEDNNFIDPNNLSKLQKYTFQVHPTFHSLIIKTESIEEA